MIFLLMWGFCHINTVKHTGLFCNDWKAFLLEKNEEKNQGIIDYVGTTVSNAKTALVFIICHNVIL